MAAEIFIIALFGIFVLGLVSVVAVVFGRGFKGEVTRERLTVQTGEDKRPAKEAHLPRHHQS